MLPQLIWCGQEASVIQVLDAFGYGEALFLDDDVANPFTNHWVNVWRNPKDEHYDARLLSIRLMYFMASPKDTDKLDAQVAAIMPTPSDVLVLAKHPFFQYVPVWLSMFYARPDATLTPFAPPTRHTLTQRKS